MEVPFGLNSTGCPADFELLSNSKEEWTSSVYAWTYMLCCYAIHVDEEGGGGETWGGGSLPSNKSNNIALCDVRVGAAVESGVLINSRHSEHF